MASQRKNFYFAAMAVFVLANGIPAKASEAALKVGSTSFTSGSSIPVKFTADGADLSPALTWSSVPAGAKSIAISVDDPDAPGGTWWHWIIYDLSPKTTEIKEGISKNRVLQNMGKQARNDFGKIGYNGPAPPGGKVHHYYFRVFALDNVLGDYVTDKKSFARAIDKHVLCQGLIVGTYRR